jgi:preprotein translocase subunit SecA
MMFARLLAKILGTANERQLRRLQPIVARINELESHFASIPDEKFPEITLSFKQRYATGESLDSLLPEAFAATREAAKRTLGQRHFDVQLLGGIVLHQGKIAEMKTGEGKTLTATLALYLNALTDKGVHLVTVNDYLANRDAQWMAPIYNLLGVTVAALQNSMSDQERKIAYQSDILYATNNELGFDYLRDNMKFDTSALVQRSLPYAIVDEVDSILIDEARTPLIISGPSDVASGMYHDANRAVLKLKKDQDYEVDEKARNVTLTELGNDAIEHFFSIQNLYALEHAQLLHHAMQALRAHALFKRDVDYIVQDGQVFIVDEFTGRVLPGRRYSDGLHQALEAKEHVEIERESQTLASITLQNYFRLYKKLAGMTGTASTEAEEFHSIYKLDVIVVPTNKKMIRDDKEDLIFLTKNAKYKAIVEDIKERYKKGQPVLIGTIAIETSELLSAVLDAAGIPHEVLNAKQHAREADIVAHAGEVGKITIATNMAGRGTDIKLTDESRKAGGLYILGTERHESRRIDNQLRGRSGRQGDPGESRFYISIEDDLIRIFGSSIKDYMTNVGGMKEDEIIEHRWVSRAIEIAQEKVEKHNFEIRKHLLEYDDVLNQQRIVIYNYRADTLRGDRVSELIYDFIAKTVQDIMQWYAPRHKVSEEERLLVCRKIHELIRLDQSEIEKRAIATDSETLSQQLIEFLEYCYTMHRTEERKEIMQAAEKWFVLETIDNAWKNHMLNLDHLKEGIGLRGWGQKNPLIEYKREAFFMFQEMVIAIRQDIIRTIFHPDLSKFDEAVIRHRREQELQELEMSSALINAEKQSTEGAQRRVSQKVGRNENCSCGSGKKYKKCCGLLQK